MKTSRLFACVLAALAFLPNLQASPGVSLLIGANRLVRRLYDGPTSVSAANVAGNTGQPTPGSFASAPLFDGANMATVTIAGSYSGQFVIQHMVNGVRYTLYDSYILSEGAGTLGVAANATGPLRVQVGGGGGLYVVASSLASGAPTVDIHIGAAGGSMVAVAPAPLATGAATSANQTSQITLMGAGLPAALNNGSLATSSQGITVSLPPAGWASGTAWTFPAGKHVRIWTGLASGAAVTVYIDGGGQTAFPAGNVTNGVWDPLVSITKIYSPADGSFPSGLPTTGLYATYY